MAESKNKTNEKTKSFFVRLASTIVMLCLGIGALYLGGWALALLMTVISLGGVFELLRVFQLNKTSLATVTYIFVLVYNVLLYFQQTDYLLPCMILYLLVLLTIYVIRFPKHEVGQLVCCFFTFFYVVVCLGYVELLRYKPHGFLFVLPVLICSCGNDMFAYLVGILIGKHKMFPNLSPKKSVEGFVGGILGSALIGVAYGFLFAHATGNEAYNYPLMFGIICGIGALPAVVGDLVASAIKRNYGIKDYGNLIPGHGGIMDRFDSMIFTAPIVYYLVTFLLGMYV